MLKMLKGYIQGLPYLLSHPIQLRHIVLRETRYRRRYQSKQQWTEWQKYDTHSSAAQHGSAEAYARPVNKKRIQTFSKMINGIGNKLTILDVGCGDGVISEPVSKLGNNVVSVDLPTITKIVNKKNISSVVAGDAQQLSFASKSFDIVLASEMVEHLWDPHGFFDEVYRVLKPAGYMIVETPEGREGLRYDSHKHFFTVDLLRQMGGKRFTVEEVVRLEPDLGIAAPAIIVLLHKI